MLSATILPALPLLRSRTQLVPVRDTDRVLPSLPSTGHHLMVCENCPLAVRVQQYLLAIEVGYGNRLSFG